MWITVTLNDSGVKYPISVNMDNIEMIKPMQNRGCLLHTKAGATINVVELFPAILKQMEAGVTVSKPAEMKVADAGVDFEKLAEEALKNHLKFPNTPFRQSLKKIVEEVVNESQKAQVQVNTPKPHKAPGMTTAALG